MATIDQFKAQLTGGGARANQFRVTMNTPGAVATGLDARRTSFLVVCRIHGALCVTLAILHSHVSSLV